jgi:hypothetical protein
VVRARRRLVEARGRITDASTGDPLATGEALYVAADEARKRQLQERYGFRFIDGDDGDAPAAGPAFGPSVAATAGDTTGNRP